MPPPPCVAQLAKQHWQRGGGAHATLQPLCLRAAARTRPTRWRRASSSRRAPWSACGSAPRAVGAGPEGPEPPKRAWWTAGYHPPSTPSSPAIHFLGLITPQEKRRNGYRVVTNLGLGDWASILLDHFKGDNPKISQPNVPPLDVQMAGSKATLLGTTHGPCIPKGGHVDGGGGAEISLVPT